MKRVFFLIFICQSFIGAAQTELTIRNHSTEVNNQTTESIKHGYEGPLYNKQCKS